MDWFSFFMGVAFGAQILSLLQAVFWRNKALPKGKIPPMGDAEPRRGVPTAAQPGDPGTNTKKGRNQDER